MPQFRQASFAGGELMPTLWGRHDLAKYAVGLKRARNFFLTRQGAAMSRPGTTYVATSPNAGPVRLVPFVFSDTQSFVLEFGAGYIRFYQNGGVVLSGGAPYQVTTPYAQADLAKLQFAQSGDVITVTHKGYAPRELKRLSNTNWTLTTISFAPPAYTSGINTVTLSRTIPANWSNAIAYGVGSFAFYGSHFYESLQSPNTSHQPDTSPDFWVVNDLGYKTWVWQVTALVQGADGVIRETAPYSPTIALPTFSIVSQQFPVGLSATPAVGATVWGYRVYRGQATVVGLIGTISGSSGAFTDTGLEPDYTQQPPQGANPFVQSSPGSLNIYQGTTPPLSSSDYPSAVTFFEQRRVFGGMVSRPDFVAGSATGSYTNFDLPVLSTESSPFLFELASQELADIRWMLGEQQILIGTGTGVYSLAGAGGPLAYNNVNAKRQTDVGASYLRPLKVEEDVLFTRSLQTGVHALRYNLMAQRFASMELSLLAQHLFIGHQVVDWAYARDPWGLVFAVREDGLLSVLAYLPDQEVTAWSWYDTQGAFEAVASIPEGTENYAYVEVARTVNGQTVRFIERFASRVVPLTNGLPDVTRYVGLDAASVYSGAATTTISGLGYLAGRQVYALADGAVQGPFTVSPAGGITLTVAASYATVGLAYTPELQTLDLVVPGAEIHDSRKNIVRVGVDVDTSRGMSAGPDFNHLTEALLRQVSDGFNPAALTTGLVLVPANGTWGLDGDVCIRQPYPLPLTVLGIVRETSLGD